MTPNDVIRALSDLGTAAASRCVSAAEANDVQATFPPLGRMTVREAKLLYGHRKQTLAASGVGAEGIDESLNALGLHDDEEELLIAGFSGGRHSFVAFLDGNGIAIGCIGVPRGTLSGHG